MLNFDGIGNPLAIIVGGKFDKKIVSCSDSIDSKSKRFNKLILEKDSKFQHVPSDRNRDVGYITGASGSGKSFYMSHYVKEWRKLKINKKKSIFLFSSITEDACLDDVGCKRIIIDESLIDDPLSAVDFTDALLIFDDIDVINNKKIREAVYSLLDNCLQIGRHYNISILISNHLPSQGNLTRICLCESHFVVYFPFSGNKKIKYLLTEYLGLDKLIIRKIKATKSRWACIFKNYPNIYLTETEIGVIDDDDN